jgi:glycosyltransferase involved in cell wall biosynthesis
MGEQRRRDYYPNLISVGDINVAEKDIEVESRKNNLHVNTLRFKNGFNINGVRQIISAFRAIKANIIHSHGYKGNILLGFYPRHLRKIPMISTLHGWTSTHLFSKMRCYEYLDMLSLSRIDSVVVVSNAMLRRSSLRIFGIHPKVIHNGIPRLDFDGTYLKEIRSDIAYVCNNRFKILGLGRLSPGKGFDLLIKAAARLHSRGIDCCLVIVGEGDEKHRLTQIAAEEGVADRVHMIGYVHDAYKIMSSFDVFALPSYTEGLPITVLEAMQAGLPIVATTVGDVPEVLAQGECGYMVQPGNSTALSNAIEKIFRNRDDARAKAEAARQRVHSEYSVERMADKYMHEYRRLLEEQR